MKTCSRCGIAKPETEFSKDKGKKDGLHSRCKPCNRAVVSAWQKTPNGRTKHAENSKRWRNVPKNKASHARAVNRWQYSERGKARRRIIGANYHASKLHRTPPWLTESQLAEISQFYEWAKELQWLSNQPLEVDHIVPLQGKNVCGLHVPWNLQILPQDLNRRKSNSFDPKNTFENA